MIGYLAMIFIYISEYSNGTYRGLYGSNSKVTMTDFPTGVSASWRSQIVNSPPMK